MKIINKKTDDLIPYVNNPRNNTGAIDKVASSIKNFGFKVPVVIDKNNEVVTGHTRLLASKKLGLKEIPCIIADDLTDAQIKAYRIADNKVAEFSEWDDDLLNIELAELKELDIDLEITGFDMGEIENLLDEEKEVEEDDFNVDDAIDEIKEPVAKRGQIYKLGEHRLMCGDSTSEEDVKLLMDGEKADMVFTDPPYGVDYKGINNDDRKGLEDLLDKAFNNYFINSKSGSSIYCFHSDKCADIFHVLFRKYFHFSSMIIWEKGFTLSQGDYQSEHEPCLYGWLKNGTHKFMGNRKQTTIWKVKKQSIEGHTTPKPIEFISKAINNSSKSEDIIIDLFGGSGSTLIACEQTNRKCYMMELDEKYVDVIIKRWEEYTGNKAELIN